MKLSLKKPSFSIPHHWLVPNWRQEFSERRLLMLAVAILACLGVTIVGSASMSIASADFNDPFYFFRRHLIYMFLAVTTSIVVANIPLLFWRKWMPVILICAFVCLILVLTPLGKRINGSARWLGIGGLTIQPSEVAKFAVILYMSDYLVRRQDDVRKTLFALWRSALVVGGTVGLLMGEPDFGATLVLLIALFGMLFVAGAPAKNFLILLVAAGSGIVGLAFSAEYRVKRLLSFWNPYDDVYGTDYQLIQSLIAFGRGDWFGVGLGHSVQKLFYLPEAHTDFVFAIYAEELGFVGVAVLLTAFYLFINTGARIARKAMLMGKLADAYLAYGIVFLLLMQIVINVAVCTGLFPTKGLTLPFISYGGSSLIMVFVMFGMLLRIDTETNQAKTGVST